MTTQALSPSNRLFSFAYVSQDAFKQLASRAEQEDWSIRTYETDTHVTPLLKNYLTQVYGRAEDTGCITYNSDRTRCAFNTGLFDRETGEDIIAFFRPNNRAAADQQWLLEKFCALSDVDLQQLLQQPPVVTFYTKPSDIYFDPTREIRCGIAHIADDRRERLPTDWQSLGDSEIVNRIQDSLSVARRRALRDYKVAVPTYYPETQSINWLLPAYNQRESTASASLLVTQDREDADAYAAVTVLTVQMAYSNARLLTRPGAEWLLTAVGATCDARDALPSI